ncbi:MAG: dihydropteroate synthase [Chitinophagaceae bacterium]|nr:MAG: dihydropteroate synthase [Chitinophagaceae bacterium]
MFTLNCKGRLITFGQPVVMGIMNTTPDSFFSSSRINDEEALINVASKMISDGAGMIDIGGQSTRPGSVRVSAAEETERVVKPISVLHAVFPELIISVDTYYASVAKASVLAGASVVNDISGGMMDADMLDTVGKLNVPFICTHMKGTPETMQLDPVYEDVTLEILDFLVHQVKLCNRAGIKDVIIDPGIGFGKTMAQNFELIHKLERFSILDNPLLLGVSRKGTIYKTLETDAAGALNGTTVLNTIGLMKGASILRVHDVREAVEAVKLVSAVNGQTLQELK